MNTVRWGLISTANINRKLIPAIRASRRGTLQAVASRSAARAETYAREWSIPHSFGSYQDLLKSGDVDAVYISLPNHLHAAWTIKALEAGLHVLCEKPLALSLAEVDAMIEASRKTDRALAEAFMYRHHPQTRLVGDWVRSGKLGEVTVIRGTFDFYLGEGQRNQENLNVRLVPEYGGGSLWDVGVYPVSFAQYLMGGPPQWVCGAQQLGPTGIDETFHGQMGYGHSPGRGPVAQFSSSFQTPFHTYLEVIGSAGRLHLTRPFTHLSQGLRLTFTPREGEPCDIPVPEQDLYLGEVQDLNEAIQEGREPYLGLEESRGHIQTVLALYQSARQGQVVQL